MKPPWPSTCVVKYNRESVGLPRCEVFCSDPETFIRGEGPTLDAAEETAWLQYVKIIECTGHVFDNRSYDSGVGWCVHCDMFSPKAFEPARTPCAYCGRLTAFIRDLDGVVWCMNDWQQIPADKRTDAWHTFYDRPATRRGYIAAYRAKFKEPTV